MITRSGTWAAVLLAFIIFTSISQARNTPQASQPALDAPHQSPLALPAGAKPGYLIIAPEALVNSQVFEFFMSFKAGLGYNIYKTSLESIDATQPGNDLPEKIRNYLIYVYEPRTSGPANIRYLLLVGEHDVIAHRMIYPRWTDFEPHGAAYTDWYYADLTGLWDSNSDGIYGQGVLLDDPTDQADLHYEIAVGRLPFSHEANVQEALSTIVFTERNGSDWKQQALMAAAFMEFTGLAWDDDEEEYDAHGKYIGTDTDNAVLMERIWQDVLLPLGFSRTRLYETGLNVIGQPQSSYDDDASLNLANMEDAWEDQAYGLVNIAAHGSDTSVSQIQWTTEWVPDGIVERPTEPILSGGVTESRKELEGESFFNSGILEGLYMPGGARPVVAIAACSTAGFDNPDGLGASLLAHGKATAFFGSLGSTGYAHGWSEDTHTGTLQDVLLRFNRVLLSENPRVGDAVYQTLMQLFDETPSEPRGRALVKDVLYGDPAMSYWGEGAAYDGPWPMFRHDIRNSGRATIYGPTVPEVRWTFLLMPGGFTNGVPSPIVDGLGKIYAGNANGRLFSLRANGTEAWHYDAGGAINAAPIATVAGNLYFRAEDGYLYAITRTGQLRWQHPVEWAPGAAGPTPSIPPISNSPRVSPDGIVYALAANSTPPGGGAAMLTCTRPTGMIYSTWFTSGGAASTPAIAPNGVFYASLWNGWLLPFSPADCSDEPGFDLGIAATGSPAIGSDGTIYIGNNGGRMYAINPDMSERWHFDTLHGAPANINSSPAVGADGSLYFGSWDHRVYALNSDGSLKWQFDTGGPVDSSPALDPSVVYVVGGIAPNATLYAIYRSTGNLRWSVNIGGSALWGSSPAIGYDGMVYVVSSTGLLYAIGPYERTEGPSEAEAEAQSEDEIAITWWDNGTDETGYDLERRTGWSGSYQLIANLPANQVSYNDKDLDPNQYYFYRLRAQSSNPSGYSNVAFTRTLRPFPAAPTGLAATAASSYAIRLTWNPLDPHATGAAIYRSSSPTSPYVLVGVTQGGATSFLDINPDIQSGQNDASGDPVPGKTYTYRIQAFNDRGSSPNSNVASGATSGVSLPAPTNLLAVLHDFSYATLSWLDHASGETGYIVERTSSDQLNFEVVAVLPANTVSFADHYLEGGFYTYRVRAYNAASQSPFAYSNSIYCPETIAQVFVPLLRR
ncbi:MAG: PQQ-binding-like beta-propeller repeat protein [Anaerolineales bacterium]|nr:PQQ-binding-like beta-propeller repeat protein [Anaerolineales bacterium]